MDWFISYFIFFVVLTPSSSESLISKVNSLLELYRMDVVNYFISLLFLFGLFLI